MTELDQLFQRLKEGSRTVISDLPTYSCEKCQDREIRDRGDGLYIPCECKKHKAAEHRVKSCMIDNAFTNSTFENFKVMRYNQSMYRAAKDYAERFDTIRHERQNGLGFIAMVGESLIRETQSKAERIRLKTKHNSYGLGKTHLQSAIAMSVLNQGVQVIMVNDSDMVAELRASQFSQDGDGLERIVSSLENAELLIWDDLGKAKTTEWVLNQYYRIFNHRYRNGKPTCFSTNEDMDTLGERIGDATASRLCAMCGGRIIQCEGPDYRQGG